MPIVDVARTNFKIHFMDEPGGVQHFFQQLRANGIVSGFKDLPTLEKGWYKLPATLEVAYFLKACFGEYLWQPTDKYKQFVTDLFHAEKRFVEIYKISKSIKLADPATLSLDYNFKTQPWDHQRIGFALIQAIGSILLTWDMRTGKTFTVSNILSHWLDSEKVKRGVILCPGGIMSSVWIRDVYKHTDMQGLALTQKSTTQRIKQAKRNIITLPKDDGGFGEFRGTPQYIVLNHDSIRNKQVVDFLIKDYDPDFLVIDESHHFKNPSAQRTKAAMRIADHVHEKKGNVILMSGTPITKDIRDIWSQMRMVDPTVFPYSFAVFKNKFCVMREGETSTGETYEHFLDMKNFDKMKKRYDVRSFRVNIEDCHSMPERVFSTEEVELTDEQWSHHNSLMDDLITELEEGVMVATTTLSRIIKISQITGGYCYDAEGKVHYFKRNPKIDALRDALEQILATPGRKAVVWTNFRPPVILLRKLMDELKVGYAEMTTQSPMDRNEAEYKFQHDPECRVMIASPSLSEGKDFSLGSYAIYYDNSFKFTDREQSERRIYTPESLKHKTVAYIDLVGKDSVDELILEAIREKADTNRMVTKEKLKRFKHGKK